MPYSVLQLTWNTNLKSFQMCLQTLQQKCTSNYLMLFCFHWDPLLIPDIISKNQILSGFLCHLVPRSSLLRGHQNSFWMTLLHTVIYMISKKTKSILEINAHRENRFVALCLTGYKNGCIKWCFKKILPCFK